MELTKEEKLLVDISNNYYNGRPTGYTDYEYDELRSKVMEENPGFRLFDHVVYETDSVKARHPITIPVFEKMNFKDLEQMGSIPDDWVLTPKYDGCSIVSYYDRSGNLQNILTRSDESSGVVQTSKLKGKVPNKVEPGIRAILFEALVTEGGRSKANGLINSKYKQDEVDQMITLRPFDVVMYDRVIGYEARMKLTGLDYTVLTMNDCISLGLQGDEPYLGKFPVDGVVVYSNIYPSFGRIYKFYASSMKSTVITNVIYQTSGLTGLAHAVYEFEPVKIGKITARKCGNPGNFNTIVRKKLGIGSRVKLELAKLTIPYIRENTEWTEPLDPKCEHCGSPFEEFQGELICTNLGCKFWSNFLEDRYFSVIRDAKGKEWVDEFTVNGEYNLEMMARCETETNLYFENMCKFPELLLYFVKPPKLQGKSYEAIKQKIMAVYNENIHTTLEDSINVVLDCTANTNSKAYISEVWKRIVRVISDLREIHKKGI